MSAIGLIGRVRSARSGTMREPERPLYTPGLPAIAAALLLIAAVALSMAAI
jgi:hypothetical protein